MIKGMYGTNVRKMGETAYLNWVRNFGLQAASYKLQAASCKQESSSGMVCT
jgi:hypothetical protein